jgi:amino acid transporter
MTQICGIGPFLTIPLMLQAMAGPQAILGWIAGAVLAMADGMVWAELGAAMPGAGGTYLYLREAFQYRTGRLMPFLFIWTAMLVIPAIMSTAVIGVMQYLGFFYPHLGAFTFHLIAILVVALVVTALYRDIGSIGRLTNLLCVIMLLTVGLTTLASLSHFHTSLAFSYPPDAFVLNRPFFAGLGSALLLATYDYSGYNTTAYMADELRDPGRVLPRSILFSILIMMAIYLTMNIGILGVAPWTELARSTSVGSLVMERTWGRTAAGVLTGLIIVTGLASAFTGLLGGSRVPYYAAKDGVFLPVFARLHPRLRFPHVALITIGLFTAVGTLFELGDVIALLTAVMVLVQSLGQVIALSVLRRRQPNLPRPYRMLGYPFTSMIALAGWLYVYVSSGEKMIFFSLAWLACGGAAFLFWARRERIWPFAPIEIREEFRQRRPIQGVQGLKADARGKTDFVRGC